MPGNLLLASCFLLIVSGCGGGGGGDGQDEPLAPFINIFIAEPANTAYGDSTRLSWISTDTTRCTASGGWSGTKATSGSEVVARMTQTTTFTLTCFGGADDDSATVIVSVPVITAPPAVTLYATPEKVAPGGFVRIAWTAAPALDCTASRDWNGARPVRGSELVGPLNNNASFSLACENGLGTTLANIDVSAANEMQLVSFDFVEYREQAYHPGESPIAGDPIVGPHVVLAIFNGQALAVDAELLSKASGMVIGRYALDTPGISVAGISTFLGTVEVPLEPFRVRLVGTAVDNSGFTFESGRYYTPSRLRVDLIGLQQLAQATSSTAQVRLRYTGLVADAAEARVVCSAGEYLTVAPSVIDVTFDATGEAIADIVITAEAQIPLEFAQPEVSCLAIVSAGIGATEYNATHSVIPIHDVIAADPSP